MVRHLRLVKEAWLDGHYILTIHFDVSLQVDDESVQNSAQSLVHISQETSEHQRNKVLEEVS